MSTDDDMLAEFDLSAWDAPPPPADLADAVIDRMGGTDVGIAIPVEERGPRRAWIIAGVAAAVIVLGIGVWSLLRATHNAAPATGGVVAEKARSLSLDTVHADLDVGADVRWRRDGRVLRVEQRAGNVTWHVDADETLVIDAGAASASVQATGANLRVEVQMNAMDARVIGASALTAAAVAMVTVVVYEGHVKVGTPNQQTVVVSPGTTYKVNAVDEAHDDDTKLVGSAPVDRPKVAVLGLEQVGDGGPDAPIDTHVLGASIRALARREGPYALAPNSDKELVDEKLMNNCADESVSCMAAIGAGIGADMLVYGHLEQSGDHYGVSLKLLDVARKQIAHRTAEVFPAADAKTDKLDSWARKLYLDLVGSNVTVCDADALKQEGMEQINKGQHAAALAKLEASLACKRDPYVTQLAFMESCASMNSPKATLYYKQLTPAQQTKFAAMCIRMNVRYTDDSASADCPGVDEVACVLNNYEGDCCKKYKKGFVASANDSLTRADISAAIATVKAKIAACGEQPNPGGKLVARIVVKPSGDVDTVTITTSLNDPLKACVKGVIEGVTFKQTANGGTFSYPFIFSAKADMNDAAPPANCDANKLKEDGMQKINLGQHAAALAKLEASLRCQNDVYVTQLAFMEACASHNAPKAQVYYKKMTRASQEKFAQMCLRNKVAFVAGEGYLEIASRPAAQVYVDGKDTGLSTPVRGMKLNLSAGTHKITFVVGANRYTYPVVIKEGEIQSLDKDLQ
jgi:hypothetical protein